MSKYNHYTVDLKDSVKAIESIRNTVLPKLISGKIYTIESSHNEILILMDQRSGIDYIREDECGLQGIAARVQWGDKAWNTFTIRSERHTGTKTELEKRIESIENGYFYPAFTMQAYFLSRPDEGFMSAGMVRTKDLFSFIKNNPEKIVVRKSDNVFFVVRWIDLGEMVKTNYGEYYV